MNIKYLLKKIIEDFILCSLNCRKEGIFSPAKFWVLETQETQDSQCLLSLANEILLETALQVLAFARY